MLHWRYWLALSVLYGTLGFATLALAVNFELTPAHVMGALSGALVGVAFWLLWYGRIPLQLPLIEGPTPVDLPPYEPEEREPRSRGRARLAGALKGVALLLLLLVLSDRVSGDGEHFLAGFFLTLAAGALPLAMQVLQALDRVPRNHPLDEP